MGAGERLPVGFEDMRMAAEGGHLEVLQWAQDRGGEWNEETCARLRADTWRCCSGRGSTTARGTGVRFRAGTLQCCSERGSTTVRGGRRSMAVLLRGGTWCWCGRWSTAARAAR